MGDHSEQLPLNMTCCLLFIKKFLIHSNREPSILCRCSFSNKCLCGTQEHYTSSTCLTQNINLLKMFDILATDPTDLVYNVLYTVSLNLRFITTNLFFPYFYLLLYSKLFDHIVHYFSMCKPYLKSLKHYE